MVHVIFANTAGMESTAKTRSEASRTRSAAKSGVAAQRRLTDKKALSLEFMHNGKKRFKVRNAMLASGFSSFSYPGSSDGVHDQRMPNI